MHVFVHTFNGYVCAFACVGMSTFKCKRVHLCQCVGMCEYAVFTSVDAITV